MAADITLDDIWFELSLEDYKSKCLKEIEMLIEDIEPSAISDTRSKKSYWEILVDFESELEVLAEKCGYVLKIDYECPSLVMHDVLKELSARKSGHEDLGLLRRYTLTKIDGGICPMEHTFILKSFKPGVKCPWDIGFSLIELVWDCVSLADYKFFLSILNVVLSYNVDEYQKNAGEFVMRFNQEKRSRDVSENVVTQFMNVLETQYKFRTEYKKAFDKTGVQLFFQDGMKLSFDIIYSDFAFQKNQIRELIKAVSTINTYSFAKSICYQSNIPG